MTAAAQPAQAWLQAAGLPQAWRGARIWRILDTQLGDGARFAATVQAWQEDDQRPPSLHYVALGADPDSCGLQVQQHPQGQVSLTRWSGDLRQALREQQFWADTVYLDTAADLVAWDRWHLKALARLCPVGLRLALSPEPPPGLPQRWQQDLRQTGFVLTPLDRADGVGAVQSARYAPGWTPKTSRERWRTRAAPRGDCLVLGAGLAGASVAAALARRGWQVTVLDAATGPAAGASGLPVGLLAAHVSADDSPRSRLSRHGVQLTAQTLRELLQAEADYALTGVHDLRQGRWQAQAGWVKPARLVQAWLATPGVVFQSGQRAAHIRRAGSSWQVLDATGRLLGEAAQLVLALGLDSQPLLHALAQSDPRWAGLPQQLMRLDGVRGQVSWGWHHAVQPQARAALPIQPVHGAGHLMAHIPTPQGLAWYCGATYEALPAAREPAQQHLDNLDKLRQLLPPAAAALAPEFEAGRAQPWTGVRCVSGDRLPLAGPLELGEQPSLWLHTGLGSRGLSFAALGAALIAAQLSAEPWPLPASLARHLHPLRRAF